MPPFGAIIIYQHQSVGDFAAKNGLDLLCRHTPIQQVGKGCLARYDHCILLAIHIFCLTFWQAVFRRFQLNFDLDNVGTPRSSSRSSPSWPTCFVPQGDSQTIC